MAKQFNLRNGGTMKRLLMALPLVFIVGCAGIATKTEGTKIKKESVLQIEPGKTTRQMIISEFGEPSSVTTENGMEKMTYLFKEKKVPSYLGGLVENETRSKEETKTLEVTISEDLVRTFRFKSAEE